MAGITPVVTVCEMLDDKSGLALSKEDAQRYAKKHGLEFVEGPQVLERWEKEKKSRSSKNSPS
jgi:3,4-dihydroxy 2-butanone 4-phosphate synthase